METVQSVLSILMMIGIGVFVAWKLGFDEKNSAGLASLVINITLPAYMISNISLNYTTESLLAIAPGLAVPFAALGICYVLGKVTARLIGISENRHGSFASMFALTNTIFIGLPVNTILFGEKSIPYVLLFYIGNTVIFWTIGVYGISRDGSQRGQKLFALANIRRVFSPPLSAFMLAVVFVLTGMHPPMLVLDVCKTVGSMTTPLSMLFIGIVLYTVDWKAIRPDIATWTLLAARFIVGPLVVIAFCRYLPLPLLMKKVFVIQASMPIMTQTAIIVKAYHGDYKFAAVQTSISTLVSLLTIPIYMIIMDNFNIFGD